MVGIIERMHELVENERLELARTIDPSSLLNADRVVVRLLEVLGILRERRREQT